MKLIALAAAAATMLLASNATLASGLVVQDTAWSGASLGLQGGIVNYTGAGEDLNFSEDSTFAGMGGTLGLFGGYDIQLNETFVLGLGGEINWVNVSAEEFGSTNTMNWQAAVQLRAGALVTPDTLLYGLLGYSVAGFDQSEYWALEGYEGYVWTGGGVKVGAGLEQLVGDTMFVRLEADVTFYGTQTITFFDNPEWDVTPTTASLKAGLGFKF